MNAAGTPSPLDVTDQLGRLRRSETFAGSDRLIALLSYLVEETLSGRGEHLREAVIGNAVYRRDPPYDPRIDSTVRVEARRLRAKLKDYFISEGRQDLVLIVIPTGSYIPQFSVREAVNYDGFAEAPSERAKVYTQGAGASVAVIPFRAFALDSAVRVFAEGLSDELIYLLGLEPGVRVSARNMVYPFGETQRQPAAIAAELGVDVVLQGTVREEDDQLKITVELSDRSGFVLLSDRFSGPSANRKQLQERVTATLLSRVRLDNSKMRARAISPGPAILEAHAMIYKARRLLDRQMPSSIRQALAIFQDVAASVPDYARGFSGIADCFCDLYRIGAVGRDTALAEATKAAERALQIDDRSAEAYTALATIAAWLGRDRERAEAFFIQALEVGSTPRAARIYGVFLTILGRGDEAEAFFAQARGMEPYSEQQDIAETTSRYQSRHYDLMMEANADEDSASLPGEAAFYLALAQYFAGDPAKAAARSIDFSRRLIDHPMLVHAHAELQAWLGNRQLATRVFDSPARKGSEYALATLAASIDDQDRTIAQLRLALEKRELATVWIRSDARFDRFRDSREFQALVDELNAQRAS
ncbi:hypothetical protein [Rhizobium jaguaris]|uniref:hypothetical protein n=1 Tax=Rhizobium jaguaris TaxID=1312183 RepID=UPI0013C3FCC0|nr:hypothetical protein [Rhizobium jaguaris]